VSGVWSPSAPWGSAWRSWPTTPNCAPKPWPAARSRTCRWSPWDALLARSDAVSLHVPLVAATRGLIGARALASMRPGAFLINTSRGGVVDEAAALEALDDGRLGGLALDVLAEEPPGAEHPLVRHERALITPHLGASSQEAQERVGRMIADQMAEFLIDGIARHAVNMPAMPARPLAEIAPALGLAERLGRFLAQSAAQRSGAGLERGALGYERVEIERAGEIGEVGAEALRLAVLVGLLRPGQGAMVNFVNAPILARERGIEVFESAGDRSPWQSGHLAVALVGPETRVAATGTLFGRSRASCASMAWRSNWCPRARS
jgi:D-3-phosphoglycerate dehydrogenase / 2-oxoglutarate reductase